MGGVGGWDGVVACVSFALCLMVVEVLSVEVQQAEEEAQNRVLVVVV